jgi:hypothetical protein
VDKFLQLLTMFFTEVKDPKTLFLRALTALVVLVLWLIVTNTSEVFSYLKTFSTNSVLQDIQEQRIQNFPSVAREKAMMLFSQTGADAVFIMKYKPESINDYQNIISWEGNKPIDPYDLGDKAVDKTSELYKKHLDGFNYSFTNVVPSKPATYAGKSFPLLKNVKFSFVYTCPYFNLNNIYSGYIGMGWETMPVESQDIEGFKEYLSKLCDPQRRALGRSL